MTLDGRLLFVERSQRRMHECQLPFDSDMEPADMFNQGMELTAAEQQTTAYAVLQVHPVSGLVYGMLTNGILHALNRKFEVVYQWAETGAWGQWS